MAGGVKRSGQLLDPPSPNWMLAFFTRNTRVLLALLILGFILLVVTQRKDESHRKLVGWTDRLRGHSSQPQSSGSNIESENQPHGSTLFDTELRWDDMPVPPTKIIAHAPGWTIFDRLYVLEGAIIVVTDSPELIPSPKEITSKGQSIQAQNANLKQLEPTEKEFKVISTEEAKLLFGSSSIRISGISFLSSESPQFLSHMYHFVAELLFGMWRIYSTLDQGIEINGHTLLPAPRRWIFPHTGMNEWRDYAAMNQYVIRAAFPSMTLEFSDAWEERAAIKGRVFSYDRVVVGDRVAAMHEESYSITERIAAGAFKLRGSPSWWNTIRMAVLEYSKVRKRDIMHDVPVITYVSRQNWGRRMLREKDHLQLLAALEALRDRRGLEIQIVELDRMSRAEQILVAARSTILIGLHGNGLSTLLWMRPQLQSTVIEFFYPGGFARDYEWTATALGMGYYGVWDKHIFSAPNLPQHAIPEGFHGNQIPLDAETVIQLIEHRLDRPGMTWD